MLYHCMRLSATFLSHCQYPFLKLWISLTSFISHQLSLNQQSFAFPDLSSFLTDLIIFNFLKENENFDHKKFDQSMFFLFINPSLMIVTYLFQRIHESKSAVSILVWV